MKPFNLYKALLLAVIAFIAFPVLAQSGSYTLTPSDLGYEILIPVPANVPIKITCSFNEDVFADVWTNNNGFDERYEDGPDCLQFTTVAPDGYIHIECSDEGYGGPYNFTLNWVAGSYSAIPDSYIHGNSVVDGSLGVGVLSPQEKLDVNGNLLTRGSSIVYGNSLISGASYNYGAVYNFGKTYLYGNVGIGTTAPTEMLDIKGNVNLNNQFSPTTGSLNPGYYVYKFGIVSYGMKLQSTDGKYGTMIFGPNQSDRFIGFGKVGAGLTDSQMIEYMRVDLNNGNVGIGTKTPDQALTVKGKIHANEVIIDILYPIVPDYVFKPNYKLMPLSQVEQYVNANSHLPEIPSAAEVSKNGMSVGEMQNKLLQKVEELTLYMIEQQKTINQQNSKIEELEKKLK